MSIQPLPLSLSLCRLEMKDGCLPGEGEQKSDAELILPVAPLWLTYPKLSLHRADRGRAIHCEGKWIKVDMRLRMCARRQTDRRSWRHEFTLVSPSSKKIGPGGYNGVL